MKNRPYKRRRKLIKPVIQLKLTLMFTGLCALALLLQFVLFMSSVSEVALSLPHDDVILMEVANGMLLGDMLFSAMVFLPLCFAVGVLMTFRIAGPIYRFEMFLKQIRSGERPPDFRLRKNDELQELATLLNEVTAPLRATDAPAIDVDEVPSLIPESPDLVDAIHDGARAQRPS